MSVIKRGIKNATFLSVSSGITVLIQFVATIYIATSLGPSTYGYWATIGAFVYFFSIFSLKGGFTKTLVREGGKDISSMNLLLERTIGVRNVFIFFSIFLCIFALFFVPYNLQVKFYIIIYSLSIGITGLKTFVGSIYHVTENFFILSFLDILEKLLYSISAILALHFGYGILGLLYSALGTSFAFLILRYIISRRFIRFRPLSGVVIEKDLLKPIFVFSILGFFSTLAIRIDLLMLSIMGTPLEVGIYGVAYNIVSQLGSVRNQVATAFFPISVKYVSGKKKISGWAITKVSLYLAGIILLFSFIIK